MLLSDLEPQFLKREDNHRFQCVATLAEADGIKFLCPKCFTANNGAIGTHGVICWSPSVPQDTRPTPGRWEMQGTGIDDLTLVAGSSSVALKGGCEAHFFVRNGAIKDC
jgi:hypothetical protein